MIDSNTIKQLALIIKDYSNNHITSNIAKKKINGIFHNKSISTIFRELNTYNQGLKKEKNTSTLVVTTALYIRNLDAQEIINNEIIKYNMTGALYGGLYGMFCSSSSVLKIDFTLSDSSFSNKFEFLHRYYDYSNFRLTACLKSIKTLYYIDKSKFDLLAYGDKTKFILLSMVNFRLNIKPSNELLVRLIKDNDDLNQNIALYFLTFKLDIFLNRYPKIKAENASNRRKFLKEVDTELTNINHYLFQCDNKTRTSLLFNCILQHQKAYPECFARTLVDKEHQTYFCDQIKTSGKIRSLKELMFVADLIKRTPALDDRKKRISKLSLYNAIAHVIIKFIEEEKGIYGWDQEQQNRFLRVCENLPVRCLKKILSVVQKKQSYLMCDSLDEMVRFKIFIEDKRKNEILNGMQNVITPLIK